MKKMILFAIVGAVLFGASYGASTMMNASKDQGDDTKEKESTDSAPIKEASNDHEEIAMAFKPESMTAETVIRLSDSLRKREKALGQRQQRLDQKEQQITLLLDDLTRERTALEMLRVDIDQKISTANPMFTRLMSEQKVVANVDSDDENPLPQPIEELAPVSPSEEENIKTIAAWMVEFTPEQAATQFKHYSNDGDLDLAARLLGHLDEKQAAKILGALNDPVLMSQLIDRFKLLKKNEE